jgi:diguanylate cyclase (GGDEF)-like protein
VLLGLQVKFTLLVVGLALCVGAIVGTITVDFSSKLVNRLQVDHCRQVASWLADRAAAEYELGSGALRELADELTPSEPLLFVCFMDASGHLLASSFDREASSFKWDISGFTPNTTMGGPRFVSIAEADTPYLDVTYPVRSGTVDRGGEGPGAHTTLLGYCRIGFSLERTFAEVRSTVELLTGIAVLIAALTVPLGFLVVQRMVGPLHDLARTMSRFADGDLDARSSIRRHDEIGELAKAYDVMAEKLAQKHHEISEFNAQLESRVQQRTRQLRDLAARDPLTGLYNRRHFNEVLRHSFAEAKRYGNELSCMMIDLDDFKSVNDVYGHQTGDDLLITTGITITTELRTADVAARYGGDEFVILLPQTDTPHAQVLGQRIMSKLRATVEQQFPGSPVSISIGVGCMLDVPTQDADDLIRVADKALYEAKTLGKNRIVARAVLA